MSALAFLFIVVLISGIGTLVLVLRNRRPTSMESGIDAFRREMKALAPPQGHDDRPGVDDWSDPRSAERTVAEAPPGDEHD